MDNKDIDPINLSTNYSGACEHIPLSNENILKLTDAQTETIHGTTLFALKYRVLPCTVTQNSLSGLGDDNAFTFTLGGHFSAYNRGRQWSGKSKQGGMYHATR